MTAVLQPERPYTVEDLTSVPDDGRRYEVIGGELVVSPVPPMKHQRVSIRLSRILGDYLERVGAGEAFAAPLDVVLGMHDIVQPDLVVVLQHHAERVTDAGIDGAPDIVIEITSPSSQRIDRIRKSATYATFGVPEYWIVDPETETILVQALMDGRYQSSEGHVRSVQLPDLVVDPSDIFALPRRPGKSDHLIRHWVWESAWHETMPRSCGSQQDRDVLHYDRFVVSLTSRPALP